MSLDHNFWLLEEGSYSYSDYGDFVSRKDAPVRLFDEVLRYFDDTLSWIPTLNPARDNMPVGQGLNWYGPTIINQAGGSLLQCVCRAWANLFVCGPARFTLRGLFEWQWPFEEDEHVLRFDQTGTLGDFTHLEVERDDLVQTLMMLATFGEQTATGTHFILHLGI